jgi:hypothetical protein
MDIDHYDNIKISADFKTFSFVSKGPKGDLVKLVKFINLQRLPGTYNLALGTIREIQLTIQKLLIMETVTRY